MRTDDTYLYRWLHCRDWDVEAGFKRLMKSYNFRVSFCKTFIIFYDGNKIVNI